MSKHVKLSASQKQLVTSWEQELSNVQNAFGRLLNELMMFRLERIAIELGVPIDDEEWRFDFQSKQFVSIDKPQEVSPSIPGRKRGRPKKGEEVIDAEVVEEEPQLDLPVEDEQPN